VNGDGDRANPGLPEAINYGPTHSGRIYQEASALDAPADRLPQQELLHTFDDLGVTGAEVESLEMSQVERRMCRTAVLIVHGESVVGRLRGEARRRNPALVFCYTVRQEDAEVIPAGLTPDPNRLFEDG
jgi:hypothetical protein